MRKAARRSCELANPAQVRQIASQTGVLFSARGGLLLAGAPLWRGWPRRRGETVAGRGADARAGLLLFGWCAEGIHLVYYFHWDAKDSVQLFVCGGVVVAEEPYYCNELVVGYLTDWLVVSLV